MYSEGCIDVNTFPLNFIGNSLQVNEFILNPELTTLHFGDCVPIGEWSGGFFGDPAFKGTVFFPERLHTMRLSTNHD
jgi:hypothetical protein